MSLPINQATQINSNNNIGSKGPIGDNTTIEGGPQKKTVPTKVVEVPVAPLTINNPVSPSMNEQLTNKVATGGI
ncbi:MAG TPA: hypothetical protein VJK54_00430 [Chthoniobacterales bacterium]|nr:hypothetical protein [Chthoniobacterales bacterium]